MPPIRPMLDDMELQNVQTISARGTTVDLRHAVPGLEGDFLQRLGERHEVIDFEGVITGDEAADTLRQLREKYHGGDPIPFTADIATATRVDQVLIDHMAVREIAGRPDRYAYRLRIREYTPASPASSEEPPPEEPQPPGDPETGRLEVEVVVEGEPDFDGSRITLTLSGNQQDGTTLERTLTNRSDLLWTEETVPPSETNYRVEARTDESEPRVGQAETAIRPGQTSRVTITLAGSTVIAKRFIVHFHFDNALVEPCMMKVLERALGHAQKNPQDKVLIVGHTDLVGSDDYNQKLSERRARAVFAAMTFGVNETASVNEWNHLRGQGSGISDSWGTREIQLMLQRLDYYRGAIDDQNGPMTRAAVHAFQADQGLGVDGNVGDQTWPVLIRAYLLRDQLSLASDRLFPNTAQGCQHGSVKWLGCGEKDWVRNTQDAWRPNRRTEILFVRANSIPCQVAEPVTRSLGADGAGMPGWCLGPGDPNDRCCFLTRTQTQSNKWLVRPAEPGTVQVRGRITKLDGTPLANHEIRILDPDGKFLDGEVPVTGAVRAGTGNFGRTGADGRFQYSTPSPVGIFSLEVKGAFLLRLPNQPNREARGPMVCRHLSGSQSFEIVAIPLPPDPTAAGALAVGEDDYRNIPFTVPSRFQRPPRTADIAGLIRYPAQSAGRNKPVATTKTTYPLVLIVHGQHGASRNGRPIHSHEGHEYLARHLASHGYIAASVDNIDLNQHQSSEQLRAEVLLRHMTFFQEQNRTHAQLAGHIDLTKVMLVGHSRGGLAVIIAARLNRSRNLNLGFRALVSIAPTSDRGTAPGLPQLYLVGSADQDTRAESSAEMYDRSSTPRSMLLVRGGIHAFFNSHPDWVRPGGTSHGENNIANLDNRVISERAHQNLAKATILAFAQMTIFGETQHQPLFFHYRRPDSLAKLVIHPLFATQTTVIVDDFQQNPIFFPGHNNPNHSDNPTNTLVFPIEFRTLPFYEEWNVSHHNTNAGFFRWDRRAGQTGLVYRTHLADQTQTPVSPPVLGNATALSLRVMQANHRGGSNLIADFFNPANQPQEISVALVDGAGQLAKVRTQAITSIPYPYFDHDDLRTGRYQYVNTSLVLKTILIPLDAFTGRNPRLNLADLRHLEMTFEHTSFGEIAIDELVFIT